MRFVVVRPGDGRTVLCVHYNEQRVSLLRAPNPTAAPTGGHAVKHLDDYTVVIRPDDNGTFVAYAPAIEGCHAWGQSPDDARAELYHVFEMIREEAEEQGRSLPPDVELIAARAS
jgi:predicted RNase H-like HicB family nuclease